MSQETPKEMPAETSAPIKATEKGKSKKWLWVGLIVLVILLLAGGYYYWQRTHKKASTSTTTPTATTTVPTTTTTTPTAVTSVPATTTTPAVDPNAWKNYTNSTYGFSLTFPNDNWKNYKVIEFAPTDGSATKYLYLAVPTTDASWSELNGQAGFASPEAITVYTTAQWAAVQNDPTAGTVVGQNSTYVFTMGGWQATPSDLANTNFATKTLTSSFTVN